MNGRLPDRPPDIRVVLPLPVGANKRLLPVATEAFAVERIGGRTLARRVTRARLVKRRGARSWAEDAAWEVAVQRGGRAIAGRCAALLLLGRSGFDADAPVKEMFDALQAGGAVVNDRTIRPYAVDDDPDVPPGHAAVLLWDLGP